MLNLLESSDLLAMLKYLLTLALVTFLSASAERAVSAEDAVESSIRPSLSSVPTCSVNIGLADPGDTIETSISLLNTTNHDLVFDSVATGCNCIRLSPTNGTIPVGDRRKFKLSLEVPKNVSVAYTGALIEFMRGGSFSFRVNTIYEIGTHVGFPGRLTQIHLHSQATTAEFRVPILIGRVVDISELQFSVDDADGIYACELSTDNSFLQVKASDLPNAARGIYTIVARRKNGAELARQEFLVSRNSPVKISPSSLFLPSDRENVHIFGAVSS
ncbi:MAG: hypothetical protein AAFP69_05270 [Planctomycetota bacterium]